jgi:Putative transposase
MFRCYSAPVFSFACISEGTELRASGISPDGQHWISCRASFFFPVRVLSRLFRRLFLQQVTAAHKAGLLRFFGDRAALAEHRVFTAFLAPLRKAEWVVYAKRPFGGSAAVLAYLSRYTHRVAIANSRLVAFDGERVTFKWKDYRAKGDGRYKLMTLDADEFIRRFLIHVLPTGFHRIRHYGLFANGGRAENIARARQLLGVPPPQNAPSDTDSTGEGEPQPLSPPCPCCGGRMIIIEIFERGCAPRHHPTVPNPVDTS